MSRHRPIFVAAPVQQQLQTVRSADAYLYRCIE